MGSSLRRGELAEVIIWHTISMAKNGGYFKGYKNLRSLIRRMNLLRRGGFFNPQNGFAIGTNILELSQCVHLKVREPIYCSTLWTRLWGIYRSGEGGHKSSGP